jgi:hypothetical protein
MLITTGRHPGGSQAAGGGRLAARPDQTAPRFCFIPPDLEPGLWASPAIPESALTVGKLAAFILARRPTSRAIDPQLKIAMRGRQIRIPGISLGPLFYSSNRRIIDGGTIGPQLEIAGDLR